MIQNTPSLKEYFEPIAGSSDIPVLSGETRAETDPRPPLHIVQMAHVESHALPSGFVDIDVLVAQEEQTAEGRTGMQQARRDLARDLEAKIPPSLRTYRLSKGISQEVLGRMIGSTQSHVARIESGKTDVQIGTMLRISKALNVDPLDALRAFVTMYLRSQR